MSVWETMFVHTLERRSVVRYMVYFRLADDGKNPKSGAVAAAGVKLLRP
jgi:hypothetical protein